MVDICLVVEDTSLFHKRNLASNPSDYSFVRHFGSSALERIQNWPCGVFFNTAVNLTEDVTFKYGVVSKQTLKWDLAT